MTTISEEKMERLYASEEKLLLDNWQWEEVSSGLGNYSARAVVLDRTTEELLRVGGEYFGPPGSKKYSFVLLYKNYAIRTWDFSGHHDGISGGHKHKYREAHDIPTELYDVNDVTTSNVNQALIDFLNECKIDYTGVKINKLSDVTQYE